MATQKNSDALLILILGLPCSGKTSFAKKLSSDLAIPQIGKDEIKELLFDHIGFEDREWSKKLGRASFELLYWTVEKMLLNAGDFIVDVDLSNPILAAGRLVEIRKRSSFRLLQINLVVDGEVLFSRFKARSLSGERHPGHVDDGNFEEFRPALLKGKREALALKGRIIEVDTTDFESVNYGDILDLIRSQKLKK